jgi:hypothetical protein
MGNLPCNRTSEKSLRLFIQGATALQNEAAVRRGKIDHVYKTPIYGALLSVVRVNF